MARGKFRRGDYIKANQRLTLLEAGGVPCVGFIEGYVVNGNPLVIEVDVGGDKMQLRIEETAWEKFDLIKESED